MLLNCIFCPVPSSGPNHVEANATSSTTIVVKWGDVPKGNENGVIEGFKVFYGALPKVPFKVMIFFNYFSWIKIITGRGKICL